MADKKKILVIDDEEDLRAIVRITMQSEGHEVAEAADGKQGIEAVKRDKPDLIILDLMMPKMNGVEFVRHLIDKQGMKDVPVLMLSAVSENSKIVKEFRASPLDKKDFLGKPLDAGDLISKARELLGLGAPAPAAAAPPAKPAAPKPAASAPEPAPSGPRLRVLSIDDDEDIRALIRAALGIRHEVETAENGMIGISKLDEFQPDFIICDMNMPVMNGLETVEAIRKHPRFHSVPVFYLTGETDKDLPRRAFETGGNLYLKKPLDPMRLLDLIDRFADETGMKPSERKALRRQAAPAAKAPTVSRPLTGAPASAGAPAGAGVGEPVRVVVVESDAEQRAAIKSHLDQGEGKGWVTFWTEDSKTALGNIPRWEPDVILYDPRSPSMDGIAFTQTLALRKMRSNTEIALVGSKFFKSEFEFSHNKLGRGIISLDLKPEVVRPKIAEVIEAGRRGASPKQQSVADLLADEREISEREAADAKRHAKQRRNFSMKFDTIQKFIDKEMR